MKKLIISSVGFAMFLMLAVTAPAEEFKYPGHQEFDRGNITRLEVNNSSGEINITEADGDIIDIQYRKVVKGLSEKKAQKLAEKIIIDIVQNGNSLVIETDMKDAKSHGVKWLLGIGNKGAYVIYDIAVPAGMELHLNSSSADISVLDHTGLVAIKGSSSDLRVEDHRGEIVVKLSSGDMKILGQMGDMKLVGSSSDIKLRDIDGEVDLTTSSGDISIDGLRGSLKAVANSGDIKCQNINGELDLTTSSGDIEAVIIPDDGLMFDFKSSSGDVSILLAGNSGATFEASTSSGDIDILLDADISRMKNHYCVGQFKNGNARIQLTSSSGDIRLDTD